MVYMVSEHWYIIYIFITYGTIPCVVADGLYQSYNGIYRFGWSSISDHIWSHMVPIHAKKR